MKAERDSRKRQLEETKTDDDEEELPDGAEGDDVGEQEGFTEVPHKRGRKQRQAAAKAAAAGGAPPAVIEPKKEAPPATPLRERTRSPHPSKTLN